MPQAANAKHVVHLLKSIGDQWVCVDGGWGVDALLGIQTRVHSDLDLIIRKSDVSAIKTIITQLGFKRAYTVDGLVYKSKDLMVDLHPVRIDRNHYAHFDLPNGTSWPFPPKAVAAEGTIAGLKVRCLSVNAQVQCHAQGYTLTPKDVHDLQALQHKFGCVLPLRFYMNGEIID